MNTQPNRWKMAFAVLALVSFCVIAYLAIRLFEQSGTLSMMSDGFQRREAALSVLRKSIPELLELPQPASQTNILAVLQKHNLGAPVVSGQMTIEMDQMRFCFTTNGLIERIEETDDYGTSASDVASNRPAFR